MIQDGQLRFFLRVGSQTASSHKSLHVLCRLNYIALLNIILFNFAVLSEDNKVVCSRNLKYFPVFYNLVASSMKTGPYSSFLQKF